MILLANNGARRNPIFRQTVHAFVRHRGLFMYSPNAAERVPAVVKVPGDIARGNEDREN
jgi:hypothetical protein